jgi:3-hydroxyacyl-[acyl-carrier-protein] dehydratase
VNATIEVPAGGTWFEGHFPGRPILPGVAELALVAQALAPKVGHPLPLQGIAFARLRQLVFPGEHLDLVAHETQSGRLRFDLKRDGKLVANGEFIPGAPEASRAGAPASRRSVTGGPTIALDELLPHRASARFLTSILQETPDGLIGTASIPSRCALVGDCGAPPVVAIEAAAQAAAAWEALRRRRHAGPIGPRIGYLVAMRDIAFFAGSVPADRELLVSVSLDAAALPLTHYRIEVSLDGMPVTRGMIATFLTGDRA